MKTYELSIYNVGLLKVPGGVQGSYGDNYCVNHLSYLE